MNNYLTKGKIFEGNKITAEFELFLDSKEIIEFKGKKTIRVGKNEYLPDFDKYLIGQKFNKKLTIKLVFPSDYIFKDFRGKKAYVNLKDIKLQNSHIKKEESKANDKEKELLASEIEKLNAEKIQLSSQIDSLNAKVKELENKIQLDQYTYKLKLQELDGNFKQKYEELVTKTNETKKQEVLENKKYALSKFLEEFMEPYNNYMGAMNAGLNSDNEVVKNYCFGFSIVAKQFENLFNENGAQLIDPIVGSEFDAHTQEVVQIEHDNNKADNSIIRVVRYGLKIGDRVVKPASVVISKVK
ncbi:nucleotide exchange factor GrpE [Mycoplasma sp. 2045]|uniref:nucleotide exchange factor GrpE n=1 Tax=Mycoplasma sp. 2045 TaxID=2967301 RepID=UPI00211BA5AE|nr:nucleotide exchange factor GrpE [Mycoplasma sp. 2045]UUM20259.1 nucleotide exchange factor GrpE [Mycoplasma sp. 2045]